MGRLMKNAKAVLYFALWLLPALILSAGYIVVADGVCHVEAPSKQQGQQHEGPATKSVDIDRYRYQGGPEPSASPFKLTEAAPQETDGSDKAKGHDPKAERWITKFFCEAKALDVALVLFTYCLVIVTGWLVYATAGLREETATLAQFAKQQAEDMKVSIEASQKSALAAEKSAGVAETTLQITQRAYLAIGHELRDFKPGDTPAITIKFTNVGTTPAYNFRHGIWIGATAWPPPEDFDLSFEIPAGTIQTMTTLSKGETVAVTVPFIRPISPEHFAEIDSGGKLRLIVWGEANYSDAFGAPHYYRICFVYDGRNARTNSPELYEKKWNESD